MMMTLQELQKRVMQLPINDRWRLVQSVLASIQEETLLSTSGNPTIGEFTELDPWTQSLIGAIWIEGENPTETYVDYLEEKYR